MKREVFIIEGLYKSGWKACSICIDAKRANLVLDLAIKKQISIGDGIAKEYRLLKKEVTNSEIITWF